MKKPLSENEIAKKAIILVGLDPNINTSELIEKLETVFYPLHPQDQAILQGRRDSHFSQKVRNLNSHYDTNFFGKHVDKSGTRDNATTWILNQRGRKLFESLMTQLIKNSGDILDKIIEN